MANNVIETVAAGKPAGIRTIVAALNWFKEAVKKISSINVLRLFEDSKKSMKMNINIQSIGCMYMFYYDPKHKKTLPYYDVFPLIFVVDIYPDGFLGLNLHYLPPYLRAKLMTALYSIALKEGDMVKLQLTYQLLKGASRFRWFKPCLKRYLFSHVRSKFLFVEPEKWDLVLMLPTQKFVKQSEETVWKHSRDMV